MGLSNIHLLRFEQEMINAMNDYKMRKCDSCDTEFFSDGTGPKSCYQCRVSRREPVWPEAHDPLVCGIDNNTFCNICRGISSPDAPAGLESSGDEANP